MEERTTPPTLVSTGIPGLDEILLGGLPAHYFYLVEGDPGVGKTTLGLQFLLAGVAAGERCLYISMSETASELEMVAQSHGWSLDGISMLDLGKMEDRMSAGSTLFHPSDVELDQAISMIHDEVERTKPERVVIDSLSEIRSLSESAARYRQVILSLKHFFSQRKSTVVLIENRSNTPSDLHVQSIAHGVVQLDRAANEYGSERRRLRVSKVRGVGFKTGLHDYLISRGGLQVFARLVAAEHIGAFEGDLVSSGIPEFDALLGGGLIRGTSSLLVGSAGTNKTTLVCHLAVAAAQRGERVSFYTFEETRRAVIARARTVGIDMEKHVRSGLIDIQQIDPADLTPGEMAHKVRKGVDGGVRMVVFDSLNGYLNSMPEEKFLLIQLHELFTYLSHRGVLTLLVLAQHGLLQDVRTPADVTYLADTIILTRYFEAFGEVKKAISVMKKRGGGHEKSIRELWVDETGLHFGEPLKQYQGVLTGVPDMAFSVRPPEA